MLTVEVGGEPLVLLPQKAAYAVRHRVLMVADVHIGKSTTFRRLGVPVPRGTTDETLSTLDKVIASTRPDRLIVLGDLLHSAQTQRDVRTVRAVADWRSRHRSLRLTLLKGNHDRRAGDPPSAWGIEVMDQPVRLGQLRLRHEPDVDESTYTLAGHVHPCVSLFGRGYDRLRVACFHFRRQVGLLPAFGGFTGMHAIEPVDGDRCYAIADGRVVPWPARDVSRTSDASVGERFRR